MGAGRDERGASRASEAASVPDGVEHPPLTAPLIALYRWGPWGLAVAVVVVFLRVWGGTLSEETRALFSVLELAFGEEIHVSFLAPLATFAALGVAVTGWRRHRLIGRLHRMMRGIRPAADGAAWPSDPYELDRDRLDAVRDTRWRQLEGVFLRRARWLTFALCGGAIAYLALIVALDRSGFDDLYLVVYGSWLCVGGLAVLWFFRYAAALEIRFNWRTLYQAVMRALLRERVPFVGRSLESTSFVSWLNDHWSEPWSGPLFRNGAGLALVVDGYPAYLYSDQHTREHLLFLLAARTGGGRADEGAARDRDDVQARWREHAGWFGEADGYRLSVEPTGLVFGVTGHRVRKLVEEARTGGGAFVIEVFAALAATARDVDARPVVLPPSVT